MFRAYIKGSLPLLLWEEKMQALGWETAINTGNAAVMTFKGEYKIAEFCQGGHWTYRFTNNQEYVSKLASSVAYYCDKPNVVRVM